MVFTAVSPVTKIPGIRHTYLVDVGFGGQTPPSPILLVAGPVQQTRHEPFRVRRHGNGYVREALVRQVWQPLYIFGRRPRPVVDLEVSSWYESTHPGSFFVTGISAGLLTDDARSVLRGRHLSVHTAEGTHRVRFDTATEVLEALTSHFGIDLTMLTGADARVSAVLDM